MKDYPPVAVLGLGAMGHAFATNLLNKKFSVSGWNRTKKRGEDLQAKGLKLYDTPNEAVKEANVIISMLVNGDVTIEAINAIASSCCDNAIFCQMGTIGIQETNNAIKLLQKLRPDITYIDAPVSGTKGPAENALITIFASGNRAKASLIEPVFEAISRKVIWFEEAGSSQKMKLVVNSLLITLMEGTAESMQLAKHFNFTPEQLWNALDGGPLAAPYIKAKLDMINSNDYTPQMHLDLALKDARLAMSNMPSEKMPCVKTITNVWSSASQSGLGEQDLAVVYHYLDKQ